MKKLFFLLFIGFLVNCKPKQENNSEVQFQINIPKDSLEAKRLLSKLLNNLESSLVTCSDKTCSLIPLAEGISEIKKRGLRKQTTNSSNKISVEQARIQANGLNSISIFLNEKVIKPLNNLVQAHPSPKKEILGILKKFDDFLIKNAGDDPLRRLIHSIYRGFLNKQGGLVVKTQHIKQLHKHLQWIPDNQMTDKMLSLIVENLKKHAYKLRLMVEAHLKTHTQIGKIFKTLVVLEARYTKWAPLLSKIGGFLGKVLSWYGWALTACDGFNSFTGTISWFAAQLGKHISEETYWEAERRWCQVHCKKMGFFPSDVKRPCKGKCRN